MDAVEVVWGWIVLDLDRDLQSTRCVLRHLSYSSPLTDLLEQPSFIQEYLCFTNRICRCAILQCEHSREASQNSHPSYCRFV